MSKRHLYRKDAMIVIFDKHEETECCYPLLIEHYQDGGNYYIEDWLEFQPELDELGIRAGADEWLCDDTITREELKEKLLAKGIRADLAENIGY